MFRCAVTGKISKPHEKAHRIVVARREKVYLPEERGDYRDRGGTGWEVASEIVVSADGLAIWMARLTAKEAA